MHPPRDVHGHHDVIVSVVPFMHGKAESKRIVSARPSGDMLLTNSAPPAR
jgi:hypothetical protein